MNFERPGESMRVGRDIQWTRPDLSFEQGEFERVAEHFSQTEEERQGIVKALIEGATHIEPTELSESDWAALENTDSFDIAPGGYDTVAKLAEEYRRDAARLIAEMNSGNPIEAPIIARIRGTLHLVSGNTRLMIARAAGQVPQVVVVEIK